MRYVSEQRERYPVKYSQNAMVALRDGELGVDQILRFEQLANDWDELMSNLVLNISLPIVNTSKHKNHREFYNDEDIQFAVS